MSVWVHIILMRVMFVGYICMCLLCVYNVYVFSVYIICMCLVCI